MNYESKSSTDKRLSRTKLTSSLQDMDENTPPSNIAENRSSQRVARKRPKRSKCVSQRPLSDITNGIFLLTRGY